MLLCLFKCKKKEKWSVLNLTNNFVSGVSALVVVSFVFFLSLKAMSQTAILCRLASSLVCTLKLVSQSVSYLRAAIL